MNKKIYISGPITALSGPIARQYFEAAEVRARELGYEPVNPMKLTHDHDKRWSSFMREDIKALVECAYITRIDIPFPSKGADLECAIAHDLGIRRIHLDEPASPKPRIPREAFLLGLLFGLIGLAYGISMVFFYINYGS